MCNCEEFAFGDYESEVELVKQLEAAKKKVEPVPLVVVAH